MSDHRGSDVTAMMKYCHGFPNFQARISDLQARPCL